MSKKLTLLDYQTRFKDIDNISVIDIDGGNLVFQCNDCHHIYKKNRRNVMSRQRIDCPYCGDGLSFPNRYLRWFMEQLPVQHLEFEYHSDWTDNKVYDAFFVYQNKNYVVEIDGKQHFTPHFHYTLEYQIENDKLKDELAQKTNVTMIRIDARKSIASYIEDQIKHSLFNELFDLSLVDWNRCAIKSTSSLVAQVCQFFNEHQTHYEDIMKQFHIGQASVYNYLKKGQQLGLVGDYKKVFKQKRYEKAQRTEATSIGRAFKAYDITTGEYIGTYETLRIGQDALRQKYNIPNIQGTNISRVLSKNNSSQTYLNFTFCYADEDLTPEEVKARRPLTKCPIAVYDGEKMISLYSSMNELIQWLNTKYDDCVFTSRSIADAMYYHRTIHGFRFERYLD